MCLAHLVADEIQNTPVTTWGGGEKSVSGRRGTRNPFGMTEGLKKITVVETTS